MRFERISREEFDKLGLTDVAYEDIKLPRRATKCSAGYDFFALDDIYLNGNFPAWKSVTVPTGIKVKLDDDKFLMCAPRSGLGFKYRLQLDNTVGIIDADYYGNVSNDGHIWAKLTVDSPSEVHIPKGEAFMQGIILPYCLAEDDDACEERIGGLGSTSK